MTMYVIENFRDPNKKYMKIEDIIAMNIPLLHPIEIGIRPDANDDVDRGNVLRKILGYYAGTSNGEYYDFLQYYGELINDKPVDTENNIVLPLDIELPLIEYVRLWPKINGKPVDAESGAMFPNSKSVKLLQKNNSYSGLF